MQELSISQSSLFLHDIITRGTTGSGGGSNTGCSGGGRVPCSANGGREVVVKLTMGWTVGSAAGGLAPTIGGTCDCVSNATAEHFTVGLPVVPRGQVQNGRCPVV